MLLDELILELDELEPSEKLEWLVEFANELPEAALSVHVIRHEESCLVQECQTPVYLGISVKDGRIHLEADVPRKSPIVRGLVALVVCGLEGAKVQEALDLPDDMVAELGLSSVLGMTRQKGFQGVIARIKRGLRSADE